MVLSRVGCCTSWFVTLVPVGAGSAGTGGPLVEVVAEVSVGWALRILGPGGKGAYIQKWSELLQDLQRIDLGRPVDVSKYNHVR